MHRLSSIFPHTRKSKIIIVVGIILSFIFYSIYFNFRSGYFFYNESDVYLSHFLGQGTFLQKIYDFRITEIGSFRGRELATLFNYIDAQFILYSSLLGLPHFLSLTHYAGLLFISGFHLIFAYKYLSRKTFWISFLLVLLFLSSPAPFFTGPYYRTSKILTAVFMSVEIWLLFVLTQKLKKNGDEKNLLRLFIVFLVSAGIVLASNLVDEGGYVFATLFAIYPLVNFVVYREKLMLTVFLGFCAGMLFGLIYRNFIGTWIILQVIGVKTPLYGSPVSVRNIRNFFNAADLLFQYFRHFWGNTPRLVVGVILLTSIGAFLSRSEAKSNDTMRRNQLPVRLKPITNIILSDIFIILFGLFSTVGVLHVMTVNHPLMFRPEVALLYYTIPFLTIFLLATTFAFNKLITSNTQWRGIGIILLIFFVALNLFAINDHYTLMKNKNSLEAEFFNVTPGMIQAIQSPHLPHQIFLLNGGGVWSTIAIRDRIYYGK